MRVSYSSVVVERSTSLIPMTVHSSSFSDFTQRKTPNTNFKSILKKAQRGKQNKNYLRTESSGKTELERLAPLAIFYSRRLLKLFK